MPIPAQAIIRRCVTTLQDSTSIRWPVGELVRYLNDGQREVVMQRPDSIGRNAAIPLTPGTRQSLPADGTKIIEIIGNAAGSRRAVRLVNREILDAQMPGWHNMPGTVEAVHYIYDPRDPRVFYVYPPSNGAGSLNAVYSVLPADIPEPADGGEFGTVVGMISLPDIYANALTDYILYRAYTKDAEYAGNAGRAAGHYSAFANALGTEIKATIAVGPVSPNNPNTPGRAAAAGG